MIFANSKLVCISLFLTLVSLSYQTDQVIKACCDFLDDFSAPGISDEAKILVESIFSKLSNETNKTDNFIHKLKYQSSSDPDQHNFWNGGSSNTYKIGQKSKTAIKAYAELYKKDKTLAKSYINQLIKIPIPFCPKLSKINCDEAYQYRTIDGSCNNLEYNWWGMYETPLKRLLTPQYNDGADEPRQKSVTGVDLPNPRKISMVYHQHRDTESDWNIFSLFFSQAVLHDISLVAGTSNMDGSPKECRCDTEDSDCFNIPIPEDDEINKDQKCMTFVRSSPSVRDFNCNLGPREQINLLTHWLDLSFVYGSTNHLAYKIRLFEHGLLKYSMLSSSNLEQLPTRRNSGCPSKVRTKKCFFSGDVRAEENAILTSLHALWLRVHNRIARGLFKLNPKWDDETIYQEARRINIAVYQHIIYSELLPTLMGEDVALDNNILPLKTGYLYKYDRFLYPQVSNEFSAAAFRIFHTLIPSSQGVSDNYYRIYQDEHTSYFQFNSSLAYTGPLEDVLYSTIKEFCYFATPQINPTLNDHLFENIIKDDDTKRWSLPALSIQRGRDHGIPGFNHYRKLCGLGKAESFEELTHIPNNRIEKLKKIYAHVDDIDLFPGLVSEVPIGEAFMGPTARCIIVKQFSDLKFGDRFYYENGDDKRTRFTLEQLDSIKKISIARILCDNSNIEFIQRFPFLVADKKWNKLVTCQSLDPLDLSPWKDY